MDQSGLIQRSVEGNKSNNDPRLLLASAQPSRRGIGTVEHEDLLAKAEEEISKLTEERRQLIEERNDLTADLEQYKSNLITLYPRTQISDDTMRGDLEAIHQAIDSFAYDTMVNVDDDDALYHFCVKQQERNKNQKRSHRSQFGKFLMKADVGAWGPYECSNFYILSVILQWILDEYVFNEEYPHGITNAQKKALVEVEDGMHYPNQGKGQLSIIRWRSEALTALTARREYELSLADASKAIVSKARDILSSLARDTGSPTKIHGQFQRTILDPALQFHRNLKTSSHNYTMDPINVSDKRSPEQMLQACSLKDADGWNPVRRESEVGRALHCLHASLLRYRTNGALPIVIVKPVVIVSRPGRKRVMNPHNRASTMPEAQIAFTGGAYVESPYSSTVSDSGTATKSRLYSVDERGQVKSLAESGPGHPSTSQAVQVYSPTEASLAQHNQAQAPGPIYHVARSRGDQHSEGSREDQHGPPLSRYPSASQQVDPRPYRRGSRDTAGERPPQRRIPSNSQHHHNPSSASLPNTPTGDSHGSIFGGLSSFLRKPKP